MNNIVTKCLWQMLQVLQAYNCERAIRECLEEVKNILKLVDYVMTSPQIIGSWLVIPQTRTSNTLNEEGLYH